MFLKFADKVVEVPQLLNSCSTVVEFVFNSCRTHVQHMWDFYCIERTHFISRFWLYNLVANDCFSDYIKIR
ncbi:hypothetical protein M2470_000925 [Parabacteroides sp. PH5-46]|nr:hypothetical protein [Parabacteroides sp. PH5-46]MDH6375873.1 hypothetical protein [Parabacteroides sp. PH5-33]